ncbi:MAG: DUF4258 domain-containing protein [Deltaproteobacteria bacterium]|nr:DUF4258 domain-containing protein [Deltaproteobacteria bacterium]
MDIERLRKLVRSGKYQITLHAQKRMDQRAITLSELKEAICQGEVVELYPDDTPFPSCLMVGRVRGGFPLYAVCALSDLVHVVTVHWMDPAKWFDPKTRRDNL